MLYADAHLGLDPARLLLFFRQGIVATAFFADLALRLGADQALLLHCRAVGAVGIHRAPAAFGVFGWVEQFAEHLAVVHRRGRHPVVLDLLVLLIGIDVILVAIVLLFAFLDPASLGVLPATLGLRLIPGLRDFACLERGVLGNRSCAALPPASMQSSSRVLRRLKRLLLVPSALRQRWRDHLAGTGDVALSRQVFMKAGKQDIDQSQALQPLTEQPDGLGVGHPVFQLQAQKTHEAKAVPYLVFDLVVRQVVQLLEH